MLLAERLIDLIDDALCRFTRVGVFNDRATNNEVISPKFYCTRGSSKTLMVIVRCPCWTNAWADDIYVGELFTTEFDRISRDDQPVASSPKHHLSPPNNVSVKVGINSALSQVAYIKAGQVGHHQKMGVFGFTAN